MSRIFHYFSGEVVEPGDRVRVSGRAGYVEEVMQPGSNNSLAHDFPDGGVLTVVVWDGVQSPMVWLPPDSDLWEDLEFIGRRDDPV